MMPKGLQMNGLRRNDVAQCVLAGIIISNNFFQSNNSANMSSKLKNNYVYLRRPIKTV